MATTAITLQGCLDNRRANTVRGAPDLFAPLEDNIGQLLGPTPWLASQM
jgi:hypothetical protein